uniref:Uncharacterized protein n=1 Tax=Romanomermis culicivorax TaxID=13658 RepID=A0A915HGF9_ROMCU
MSDRKKSDINWMYEGEKSKLNEEDYLTGRKIDRHFDRHHTRNGEDGHSTKIDSIVERKIVDRRSGGDRSQHHADERKISVLDLETVKKEDPLVAIKVREQEIRREIFDNPLKMKRLKKIVVAAMRKKFRKMLKKGEIPDFLFENLSSRTPKKEQEYCSPVSNPSSPENSKTRIRHDSSSSDEERRKRSEKQSYGLVYVNSKPKQEPVSPKRREEKSSVSRKSETPNQSNYRRPKLSEKEMEEKRREMMENARWRDEQKNRKRKKYEEDEEKERKDIEKTCSGGAQFLKPMIHRAMNDRTVEERIKSKKQHLQRNATSMETNFAKK